MRPISPRMFLRLPKGMEPTEIGRAVLRRANAILCEMLSMGADVAEMRSGMGGAVGMAGMLAWIPGMAVQHAPAKNPATNRASQ